MIETALGAELTEHRAILEAKHRRRVARGNHRNGATAKTACRPSWGPSRSARRATATPSFDPQAGGQAPDQVGLGLDRHRILGSTPAELKGVRDIECHLSGLYGVEIKRDTISRVTDAVLKDVVAWRTRPWTRVDPVASSSPDGQGPRGSLGALVGVLPGDRRQLRGRARGPGDLVPETEGAKFWLAELNDLHHRGGRTSLSVRRRAKRVPRGHRGRLPTGLGVQTCIVHQIRNSMRFVAYQDRKRVAAKLQPIYQAGNADAAASGPSLDDLGPEAPDDRPVLARALGGSPRSSRYPPSAPLVLHHQQHREPQPPDQKSIKTRGHFPDEQAATKLIYLAIQRSERKWRKAYNWTSALRGLKIHFGKLPTPRLT